MAEDSLKLNSSLPVEDSKDAELEIWENRAAEFTKRMAQKNIWNMDKKGQLAVQASAQMMSTKIGLYARIPIFCKADNCPYSESCLNLQMGMAPKGQACPIEIAQIQHKYLQYSEQFNLNEDTATFTDERLVEELITMEIYMDRCRALMSKEVSPVQTIVAGVTDNGEPIEQPAISKAAEAYEKFSKKRNEDYSLLMATRKDQSKFQKPDDQKSILDIIHDAEQDNDIYTIEQKPENADEIINASRIKKKE